MGRFVVVEGIDASGKTTITKLLSEKLEEMGNDSILVSKRNPQLTEPDGKQYINQLKEIIWPEEKEGSPWGFLNETQWILQLGLWYSVLAEQYIEPLKKSKDVLLIDGWFYKILARCFMSKTIHKNLLEELLEMLNIGDEVYLLKSDPEECWERRTSFKQTEIAPYGRITTNYRDSFISFQTGVQDELEKMATEFGWNVVQCAGKDIGDITDEIQEKMCATKNE